MMMMSAEVTVTARRMAVQEDLGDLKLYRFPERLTVDAHSAKQIGLLDRHAVRFESLATATVLADDATNEPRPLTRVLRLHNRRDAGLGLPLPLGRIALFARAGRETLLVGEGPMRDLAVDETTDVRLGETPGLAVTVAPDPVRKGAYRAELANAGSEPVQVELVIEPGDSAWLGASAKLGRKGTGRLWAVTVPANGRAVLDYRIRSSRP